MANSLILRVYDVLMTHNSDLAKSLAREARKGVAKEMKEMSKGVFSELFSKS